MAPLSPSGTTKTAPAEAWLEVIGVPQARCRPILRELAHAGLALRTRDSASRPPYGVVLFEGDDAADTLRALAAGRSDRILALSLAECPPGDATWTLLDAGASDVMAWSPTAAAQAARRVRRWSTIDELARCDHVREFLVGDSPAWRAVVREVVEIARFTDAAVLITGESGTGKERMAQLIHELDPRPKKGRLVVLDCSTVVPSLSGSEFFGHEKGAFTGASAPRSGAFELADGGTLFLDEVGELAVPLQAELLRVIQEGTFKRVGSNTWRRSAFRLVCATNRDLAAARTDGSFRNDFFYRIAGCTIGLPSLRERREDILPLFEHFYRQARPDGGPLELERAVRELLLSRPYPGNVRDLRSLALRIVHRHLDGGPITAGDVPESERPSGRRPVWPAASASPPAGNITGGSRPRTPTGAPGALRAG